MNDLVPSNKRSLCAPCIKAFNASRIIPDRIKRAATALSSPFFTKTPLNEAERITVRCGTPDEKISVIEPHLPEAWRQVCSDTANPVLKNSFLSIAATLYTARSSEFSARLWPTNLETTADDIFAKGENTDWLTINSQGAISNSNDGESDEGHDKSRKHFVTPQLQDSPFDRLYDPLTADTIDYFKGEKLVEDMIRTMRLLFNTMKPKSSRTVSVT